MDVATLGANIVRLVRGARGASYSFAEKCEQAAWYGQWAAGIPEGNIPSYPSAIAHYRASRIESTDPAAAQAGGRCYFDIGPYGHTGTVVGPDLFINSSPRTTGQSILGIGNGLYVSSISAYAKATGAKYLGSTAPDFALDAYGAALAGNQRRVLSTVPVRRRSAPSSGSPEAGDALAPGTVGNFDGWIHGEAVSGNDVWFRGISGNWFWSGGFTDSGTHDLADLNAPAIPAGSRQVGPASANRRPDPSTSKPTTGSAAAGSVIPMTGFAHGQTVNGTDLWYTDGSGWYWAGGFVTQDGSGLVDRSAEFTPPPVITPTTFGIDVSGSQASLDYAKAKAEGVGFVIVKAGGHNTSKRYTADAYPGQVDAARAAGLEVGHYYVVGKGDPAEEADYFVDHLHGFDVTSDVLALDNEQFDTAGGTVNVNTTLWTDEEVTAFFRRLIERTGIPATRLWHYFNAQVYASRSWPLVEALGVRKWPSGYGANPTDRHPQAEPTIADWWVHQFSSRQAVAGVSPVDGNWSKQPLEALFATGTVTPPATEEPDPTDPDPDPVDPGGNQPPVTPVTTPFKGPIWIALVGAIAALGTALVAWLNTLGH